MDLERLDQLIRELTELRLTMGAPGAPTNDVRPSAWLATILEASPEVITLYDLEGRITYLSRSLIPGVGPEAYVGRKPTEFLPAADRAAFENAFAAVLATGAHQNLEVLVTNGMVFETRLAPVKREGKIQHVLSIGNDVSARRKTELALGARDHQLRMAASITGLGFWRWNVTDNSGELDESAEKLVHAAPGEPRNIDRFFSRIHADDRERVAVHLKHCVEQREFRDFELRLVVDGNVQWMLCKGRFLHGADGKPVEAVGCVLDVTQARKTGEELQRARRMESIGHLAGGVAHDFNNLLMVIMANLALVRDRPDHPQRAQQLQEIADAAGRAADLTRQLLAFGSRRAGQETAIDLNALVDDTVRLLRRVIPANIEVDFIAAHRLPKVLGDRSELEQVVMNLCVNARDAMAAGGRMTLETEAVLLNGKFRESHPWARPGRYVLLTVTDTGTGIEPQQLDRIFEPFFTTKAHGTGLGLATVYGVVKRHGGLVNVYSELSKGTTFKVYLPASERDAATVGDKLEGAVRGGLETLLVAEDETLVRSVVSRLLSRAGYTVVEVEDGFEALKRFSATPDAFKLVILDSTMPRMGGLETLAAIRELRPNVPVIISSGRSDTAPGEELTRGVFIAKPYEPDAMLRAVRKLLDEP